MNILKHTIGMRVALLPVILRGAGYIHGYVQRTHYHACELPSCGRLVNIKNGGIVQQLGIHKARKLINALVIAESRRGDELFVD